MATDNLFVYGILMRDADDPAVLHGYRLDFGSFATVVEELAAEAYGGLIRGVTPSMLRYYDGIEGYRESDPHGSYYTRRRVAVVSYGGPEYAWVYVMNPRWLAASKADQTRWRAKAQRIDRHPHHHLIERMHAEYTRLHHPLQAHEELDARADEYLRELEALHVA